MPITLNGSTGLGTPGISSSDVITGTTASFSGNVTANGLSTELRPLVLGTAQTTTSGTQVDFTGIPSWVKRVTVMFNGVSTSGTGSYIIQLGTGGAPTFTSSGYTSACRNATSTTGFIVVDSPLAANTVSGMITLTNFSGNNWISFGVLGTTTAYHSAGSVTLGAALTAVRVTSLTPDTFDAGNINIMWE